MLRVANTMSKTEKQKIVCPGSWGGVNIQRTKEEQVLGIRVFQDRKKQKKKATSQKEKATFPMFKMESEADQLEHSEPGAGVAGDKKGWTGKVQNIQFLIKSKVLF